MELNNGHLLALEMLLKANKGPAYGTDRLMAELVAEVERQAVANGSPRPKVSK